VTGAGVGLGGPYPERAASGIDAIDDASNLRICGRTRGSVRTMTSKIDSERRPTAIVYGARSWVGELVFHLASAADLCIAFPAGAPVVPTAQP